MRPFLLLLASGLLCGSGAGGRAEENSPGEVAFEDLSTWKPERGQAFRVTGKYRELVNDELLLFDCDTPFLLKRPELLNKILEFKPQRDNLTLTGTTVEGRSGMAGEVEDLSSAPSDAEVFSQKAALIRKGEKKERGPSLFKLGKLALLAESRSRDPELRPLARRIFRESLEAQEDAPSAADAGSRIASIREVYKLLKDKELVLEVLVALRGKFPGESRIVEFLQDLNCRKYQGRWVTYEDFKHLEGLVEYGGRWVTVREKDLLESLEAFRKMNLTNLIFRKRTDREYRLLAERGTVEEGMKPEEVCAALGFPDRVDRRMYQQKEFDQWSYGSKYLYFYSGVLVKKSE